MNKRILFLTTSHSYFTRPVSASLQKLGYTVRVFDYQKPSTRSRFIGLIANIIKTSRWHKKRLHAINRELLNQVRVFKPTIVLAIKAETITPDTITAINAQGIITVNWFPDWLIIWKWIKQHVSAYNIFINCCFDTYQKLQKAGIKNWYLPFAGVAEQKFPPSVKKYSISFIGQHSPRREKYFSQLKNLGLQIWGYPQWKNSSLGDVYNGVTSVEKTRKILKDSLMTVNILTGTEKFHPAAVNVRTFEALSAGTLLLAHYHPILKRHFNIGKDLVVYHSPRQLRQKATYFLAHPQQARKIAHTGYNHLKQEHTFDSRLGQLLEIINQYT